MFDQSPSPPNKRPAKRQRLDHCVLELGLARSRSEAQSLIMQGQVLLNHQPVTKAGTWVKPQEQAQLRLKGERCPYVSRGGLKLAKALDVFQLNVEGLSILDVGASTGGFTDCLLQHGAERVVALDVGQQQLAWSLRQDARVHSLEQTNIRQVQPGFVPFALHAAVCDVSFISLSKVMHTTLQLLQAYSLQRPAFMVALIKPQFELKTVFESLQPTASEAEALRQFDGVVRDEALRQRVVDATCNTLASQVNPLHWQLVGLHPSPITGPKGNVEVLSYWQQHGTVKLGGAPA